MYLFRIRKQLSVMAVVWLAGVSIKTECSLSFVIINS